jgi:hypothetical protein
MQQLVKVERKEEKICRHIMIICNSRIIGMHEANKESGISEGRKTRL